VYIWLARRVVGSAGLLFLLALVTSSSAIASRTFASRPSSPSSILRALASGPLVDNFLVTNPWKKSIKKLTTEI